MIDSETIAPWGHCKERILPTFQLNLRISSWIYRICTTTRSVLIFLLTIWTYSDFIMLPTTSNLCHVQTLNKDPNYLAQCMTALDTCGTRIICKVLIVCWSAAACVTKIRLIISRKTISSWNVFHIECMTVPRHYRTMPGLGLSFWRILESDLRFLYVCPKEGYLCRISAWKEIAALFWASTSSETSAFP